MERPRTRADEIIDNILTFIAIFFMLFAVCVAPASAKDKPSHWREAINQIRQGNNAELRRAIHQYGVPIPEIARDIVMASNKKKVHVNKHRFIEGHEEMPIEVIIDDDEVNPTLRVRYQIVWEVFTAPNGEQAERQVGIIPSAESLIQ